MTINHQHFIESEIAFRNQFNPQHPNYHAGDPTPVPIGGSRIPEGAVEATIEASTLPLNTLPDRYHSLYHERQLIGKIKASVSAASKAIGGLIGPAGIPKRPESHSELALVLDELKSLFNEYKDNKRESNCNVVTGVFSEIMQLCTNLPKTKEEYGEFVMSIQQLTRQLFAEQTGLLQLMKEIKKSTGVRSTIE